MRTIEDLTDYNAESGVICTLLYHPEFLIHARYMKESFFYDTSNQVMFQAIKSLVDRNVYNMSANNLYQVISEDPQLHERHSETNITNLSEYISLASMSSRDTSDEFKMLCKRVVTLACKRTIYSQAEVWKGKCFNEDINVEDICNITFRDLDKISTSFVIDHPVATIGDAAHTALVQAKLRHENGEEFGIPSAFKSFEPYFAYERGEVVMISARMKTGKSWLAVIEAIHMARNGISVFVYDSEMNDELWSYRALGYVAGVNERKIKRYTLTPEEEERVERADKIISKLPIYHVYDPTMTNEKLYTLIAQKKQEVGIDMVIIDYLKPRSGMYESSVKSAEMGDTMNYYKNIIAGELDLPLLVFAQLGRSGEVADSDALERYCSVSVKWERKTAEEIASDGVQCGTHKATVKLNRLGGLIHDEGEYIDFRFKKGSAGIVEAQQHMEENPYDTQ